VRFSISLLKLSKRIMTDCLQIDGLPPLSTMMMIRLRSSLLSSASTSTSQIPKLPNNQHISPSLALVHLAVLHRLSPDSSTVDVDAESQMMAGRLKVVGSSETTVTAAANRQKWSGRLKRAGGVWAEAGKMVMESEVVKELERRAATSSSPTIASD